MRRQELLAWELAKALDDPGGISLYRSYCQQIPGRASEKGVERGEGKCLPTQSRKVEVALFNYLLQQYAQGTTENPGG